MANEILVFIEHADGKINRASYEAVKAAQLLGAELGLEASAVVFGSDPSSIAAEVATRKLKTVYTVSSNWLKTYTADGYAHAFRQVIGKLQPSLILMTHTYEVRDFAPKLAASRWVAQSWPSRRPMARRCFFCGLNRACQNCSFTNSMSPRARRGNCSLRNSFSKVLRKSFRPRKKPGANGCV